MSVILTIRSDENPDSEIGKIFPDKASQFSQTSNMPGRYVGIIHSDLTDEEKTLLVLRFDAKFIRFGREIKNGNIISNQV